MGSMPQKYIVNVHTASDLDKHIPEKYQKLDKLTSEQKETAQKIYTSYKKAVDDVRDRAIEFSNAQDDEKEFRDNPTDTKHLNPNYGMEDEDKYIDYSSVVYVRGDLYCRAKIHEARHEDAICKALAKNNNEFPPNYKQPRSEWWCSII